MRRESVGAQKVFIQQLGYTPYLMHGYLFTTIRPLPRSAPPPSLIVAKRIIEALAIYEDNWSDEPKGQHRLQETKNFLQNGLESLKRMRVSALPRQPN
jgi:hypothetical protein